MVLKAKENTANQTREGEQELSAKRIGAGVGLAVAGITFAITIHTALTRSVSEEVMVILYLIIGATCGIFSSACILFYQVFRAGKDKKDVINAITNANGAIVNKLEPLDDIKKTLASMARTQKNIEDILKEINAKL